MPVVVRGLRNLERFKRQVATVHSRAVPELAKRVGVALVKVVGDQFRNSLDPYDRPWAPVFRRRRRDRNARLRRFARGLPARADKPLMDTRRLSGSTGYSASGSHLRVFLTANYASYHDKGTRRIKRRQVLPDAGRLGPKWEAAVEKEARRVLVDHFKGP